MGTAAIRIRDAEEFFNPNVVKVELNKRNEALIFSRAQSHGIEICLQNPKNRFPKT